jgi:hypothetical protein
MRLMSECLVRKLTISLSNKIPGVTGGSSAFWVPIAKSMGSLLVELLGVLRAAESPT